MSRFFNPLSLLVCIAYFGSGHLGNPAFDPFFPHSRNSFISNFQTCSCGISQDQKKGSFEITNGDNANPDEFPWMVKIFGGCSRNQCGGSLISPRVVLSAAHCWIGEKMCSISKRVIVGQHIIDHANIYDNRYSIPIAEAATPPTFLPNDVALARLKTGVTWTQSVSPICLPLPGENFGENAVAAGWGMTLHSDASDVLKKVDLKVVQPPITSNQNWLYTELINDQNKLVDPCAGDSGGPLMSYNNARQKWTVIGTVSGFGYDCETGYVNGLGKWNNIKTLGTWIRNELVKIGEPICR